VNASIALKVLIPRVGAAGPHMFLLGEGTVVRVDAFSYPDASASFAVAGRSFVLNRDEAALSERAVIKSRALTSGVEVSARQRPR
jgi:alpha-D-ribose 1-methylphosphonate 5-triphosphate synthase subunit PhnG